jgi:biotin operon repressor
MKQPPVISSKSRRNTDELKGAYIGSKMPPFGAIPQDLLLDPTISPQAKALYGIFHVYCSMKKIGNGSFTFVSQARIAMENLGKSQQYVCTLTKELRDAGWMTVIRRGQGRSNVNILHAFKGQKTTNEEVKFYKQEVSKIVRRAVTTIV